MVHARSESVPCLQVEALVARLALTREQLVASTAKVDALTSQLSSNAKVTGQTAAMDPLREGTGKAGGALDSVNDALEPDAAAEMAKVQQAIEQKRVNSLSAALAEAHAKNATQEEQLWK